MSRFGNGNGIEFYSSTTGTGAYAVGVATSPSTRNISAFANGTEFTMRVLFGANREVGIYTKSGSTLVRTKITYSTNGNNAVSWPAGNKVITCGPIAENVVTSPLGSLTISDNPLTGETEIEVTSPGEADDQTAAEVPFTPAGTISATDVQAALEELDGDIQGLSDSDDQTAAEVPYDNTTSGLTAEELQAAVDELKDLIDGLPPGYGDDDVIALLGTVLEDGYRLRWDVQTDSLGSHFYPDVVMENDAVDYASEIEIDLSRPLGDRHTFTLAGNPTLLVSNFALGDPERPGKLFRLVPTQDATGGRTIDFTGSSQTWLFPDGEPALTPIPGGQDELEFLVTSVDPPVFTFVRAIHRPRVFADTASPVIVGNNEFQYANVGDIIYDLATLDLVGNGSVSAGTFTITIDGIETDPIPFDADGWTIYEAILAASYLGEGDFVFRFLSESTQQLSTGATISIKFVGPHGYNPHTTTIDSSGLTGGTYSATDAGPGSSFTGMSGVYNLEFDGEATGSLSVTSNAATVQAALEGLTTIGSGNIRVGGGPLQDRALVFEFIGVFAGVNVPTMTMPTGPDVSGGSTKDVLPFRSSVATVGNEPEIDCSRYEGAYITLAAESGEFTIALVTPLPFQPLRVAVENNGASGTLALNDVDWGDFGAPDIPVDGTFDVYELLPTSPTKIIGQVVQTGCTPEA